MLKTSNGAYHMYTYSQTTAAVKKNIKAMKESIL